MGILNSRSQHHTCFPRLNGEARGQSFEDFLFCPSLFRSTQSCMLEKNKRKINLFFFFVFSFLLHFLFFPYLFCFLSFFSFFFSPRFILFYFICYFGLNTSWAELPRWSKIPSWAESFSGFSFLCARLSNKFLLLSGLIPHIPFLFICLLYSRAQPRNEEKPGHSWMLWLTISRVCSFVGSCCRLRQWSSVERWCVDLFSRPVMRVWSWWFAALEYLFGWALLVMRDESTKVTVADVGCMRLGSELDGDLSGSWWSIEGVEARSGAWSSREASQLGAAAWLSW